MRVGRTAPLKLVGSGARGDVVLLDLEALNFRAKRRGFFVDIGDTASIRGLREGAGYEGSEEDHGKRRSLRARNQHGRNKRPQVF
jgi:hypothetical protein